MTATRTRDCLPSPSPPPASAGMTTDSSPFAFSAPASLPSPAPSSFDDDDADGTPGFYESLLLSAPEVASPELTALASLLLSRRIDRAVYAEMSTLIGELRDEWKVRVGAVKADWMARFIPSLELGEEDEVEYPTIESDVEGREEMEERVYAVVEQEFVERVEEAEGRVREALGRTERMEVEVFVGGLVSAASVSREEGS